MIIKSNQESQYQLNEVVQNVIPILKMQAINAIGIKANRESIEIANKTKKITGELILKNANDIRDLATDLQNNRNSSPIDEEKLKIRGEDLIVSKPGSKVTVMIVPTNEELAIAKQTLELL